MKVVGIISEERQIADQQGYKRCYNSLIKELEDSKTTTKLQSIELERLTLPKGEQMDKIPQKVKDEGIRKWRAILGIYGIYKRYDQDKTIIWWDMLQEAVVANCSFCKYFVNECDNDGQLLDCRKCPLYEKHCGYIRDADDREKTFWKIVIKINSREKRGLRILIKSMIKAIEEVEVIYV